MWTLWALGPFFILSILVNQSHGRNITVSYTSDTFLMDGKPFQYASGSIHYFRVPHQYWQNRLNKVKLLGFNAVSTYVEWSLHEPKKGVYNFKGDADLVKFIKLAQDEGLYVILRPGPYICAERDFGGFPPWLLKDNPDIKLRSVDPTYLDETMVWFNVLFDRLGSLMYGNGGPIIAVQIENEYGYYPTNEPNYTIWLYDQVQYHVGGKAVLFTTDASYCLECIRKGHIDDVLTTVDFGVTRGNMDDQFKNLRAVMPHGPKVCSEFYSGWITYWGQPFSRVNTPDVTLTIQKFLDSKVNFNCYMLFGGTNFGFTAGSDGSHGVMTSYDYDAPISEAGDLTDKYMAIRDVMEKNGWPAAKKEDVEKLRAATKGDYGKIQVEPVISLFDSMTGSDPITTPHPINMEANDQSYGFIAYTHVFNKTYQDPSVLKLTAKDRATVIVDNKPVTVLAVNTPDTTPLPTTMKIGSTLTILVENIGRRNTAGIVDFRKGILSDVTVNGEVVEGWETVSYPLEYNDIGIVQRLDDGTIRNVSIPAFYLGSFGISPEDWLLQDNPYDTFLDMRGWGKGVVWINGHNLGRHWFVGPQATLYVPGVWLNFRPKTNTIVILELEYTNANKTVEFRTSPVFTF